MAWTAAAKAESDEERERKQSKKAKKSEKSKGELDSGDEGAPANGEVKKRRKGKLKKSETNGIGDAPDQNEALFSGDEEDKPKKVRAHSILCSLAFIVLQRIPKKRVVRDDEDDDTVGPRKKLMCVKIRLNGLSSCINMGVSKSKETISDSDEGMD